MLVDINSDTSWRHTSIIISNQKHIDHIQSKLFYFISYKFECMPFMFEHEC